MASLESNLVIGGGSGYLTPNQPLNATLALFNPTAANITIQGSPVPFATSNGNPYAGVNFGLMSSTGNQAGSGAGAASAPVVPAGGSLVFSFGLVFYSPQGSPETGLAQANCSTAAITIGVNVVTTDGNSISPTVVLTPLQAGATILPGGGVTPSAPGQFDFSSPSNSPNYEVFF